MGFVGLLLHTIAHHVAIRLLFFLYFFLCPCLSGIWPCGSFYLWLAHHGCLCTTAGESCWQLPHAFIGCVVCGEFPSQLLDCAAQCGSWDALHSLPLVYLILWAVLALEYNCRSHISRALLQHAVQASRRWRPLLKYIEAHGRHWCRCCCGCGMLVGP